MLNTQSVSAELSVPANNIKGKKLVNTTMGLLYISAINSFEVGINRNPGDVVSPGCNRPLTGEILPLVLNKGWLLP